MNDKLVELKEILAEVADLNNAAAVLNWDQETYMPDGGNEARGEAMATLEKIAHETLTSDRVGRLLDDLSPYVADLPPDSNDARLHKVTLREYNKATRVPAELVAEKARITIAANQAWRYAREESDYPRFQPHLEKIIDWAKKYAELFKPYDHVYDPLLDDYEPGMKTKEVQAIFNGIRPQQVKLIEAIAAQPQVDDSMLHQKFDVATQLKVGREVITKFGYDWNRGREDKVHHPFQTTLGYGDQRITYNMNENFFNTHLFGVMHESGHAMYEQGVVKELARSPLYNGTSLAIHESQSRLWENLVGRSLPFWQWYFPKLQKYFPQLAGVGEEEFYKAVNKVKPSFIRIEADEATYNLHIMLRMEVEIALLENEVKVKELPDFWNTHFKEYLGITPTNDAEGVLQDIHWSIGAFGYFSTYALGNLISLQLWDKMKEDHPDVDELMRQGDFSAIFNWMNDKVYQHGSKFEPKELVKRITGSEIDGKLYMEYLKEKFSAIYGL
jgi:carboxypeptidase Taq